MQAIKAGVLEIADLLVVNKSDLPDADRTAGHLKAMLHYGGHEERRRLLQVSSVNRDGMATLVEAINARFDEPFGGQPTVTPRANNPRLTLADDVADLAAALVRDGDDPRIDIIVSALSQGTISRCDGAVAALRVLAERDVLPGFNVAVMT